MRAVLARSAGKGRPPQLYRDHVNGVVAKARRNLEEICRFITLERWPVLRSVLIPAAHYHDLGKLDAKNQAVLNGEVSCAHLPLEHRDAGTKYLLERCNNLTAATLIFAHHWPGLPNLMKEKMQKKAFRFSQAAEHTDQHLDDYLKLHEQEFGDGKKASQPAKKGLSSVEYRMLLSCLVDADYTDASGKEQNPAPARWKERAEKLDCYVAALQKKQHGVDTSGAERASLRQEM
jgi:CRISPR-associated endonuclease Cas3-HD